MLNHICSFRLSLLRQVAKFLTSSGLRSSGNGSPSNLRLFQAGLAIKVPGFKLKDVGVLMEGKKLGFGISDLEPATAALRA